MRECHKARRDSVLDILKFFTRQGQTRHQEFEKLYIILHKLGKHVTITRKLIDSAVSLPQDFNQDFIIKPVPSTTPKKLPLLPREANVKSTAHRMFSNPEAETRFLSRLRAIWDDQELSALLLKEVPTKTRVHAELLLLDHFEKQGCTFLDLSDKYIGCSKGVCYLC